MVAEVFVIPVTAMEEMAGGVVSGGAGAGVVKVAIEEMPKLPLASFERTL